MRDLWKYLWIGLLCTALTPALRAQDCAEPPLTASTPVLMHLLLNEVPPAQALSNATTAQAEKFAAADYAGLLSDSLRPDSGCAPFLFREAAAYMDAYPAAREARPLWPHFNGGFAGFIIQRHGRDGLNQMLEPGIRTLMQYAWLHNEDPLAFELLGDLLTEMDSYQQARWFSSLAYIRAARLSQGAAKEGYDHKALHALDRLDRLRHRFDSYRYGKYRDIANEVMNDPKPAAVPDSIYGEYFDLLPDNPQHPVASFLTKWQDRENQKNKHGEDPNEEIQNPDLVPSEIKSNVRYNMYALGVIGIVVAAAIFLYFKVRQIERAHREYNERNNKK